MAQKSSRRPTQWMAAMSCRRPSLSGPACAWIPHRLYLWGVHFPLGELPERGQSLTSNHLWGLHSWFFLEAISWSLFTSGYFRKTAGVWNQSFPSHRWAAKGHRATPARLPVIPLATRSQHVIFTNDQVGRPHRTYRPLGGLPRGSHGPATCRSACNCPEPEAWTTEASGNDRYNTRHAMDKAGTIHNRQHTQQLSYITEIIHNEYFT